jgi:hypothetical protein
MLPPQKIAELLKQQAGFESVYPKVSSFTCWQRRKDGPRIMHVDVLPDVVGFFCVATVEGGKIFNSQSSDTIQGAIFNFGQALRTFDNPEAPLTLPPDVKAEVIITGQAAAQPPAHVKTARPKRQR